MPSVPLSFASSRSVGIHRPAVVAWLTAIVVLFTMRSSHAATPSSGTLSPGAPSLTWTGALIGGTNVDESTCNEGLTCDTFTLTLAPGDYTGQRITVGISWLVPANDYDLYVHRGTVSGAIVTESATGAPGTEERGSIPIDPPVVTSAITYVVHVVAFTVTPGDTYHGDASLVATPTSRTATYLASLAHFGHNYTLSAPITTSDGEPSLRVDVRGNCYVGGIRGVPAGVDLWRFDLDPTSPTFDPDLRNPTYLGQPDAFAKGDSTGGADGGGDIDIATSFPANPMDTPVVTIVSLAAADISSAVSLDRGATFTLSPAVVPVPSDDRQWIEADGDSTVYLMYRAPVPATGLFVARSDDHGLTYPNTGLVNPSGTTPGYIDVDHTTGAIYVAHSSSTSLMVGKSTDRGLTWKNVTVDNTTQHGTLFDVVKVGDDGTVYAAWSDGANIYLASSTDGAATWSQKVRVNDNTTYKTNLMPWIEAGSAGRVAIVWYGTTDVGNDDQADWQVLFAQTLDATDANPTFRQQVISDHVIHGSNISLGGLTGSANRNLLDYFQVAFDPQGAAVVAFTDDHNDFNGDVYVTRQLDGPSFYAAANGGSGMVAAIDPGPPPAVDPSAPQVSDYLHDAVTGLLEPIVTDNPFDILWTRYSFACDSTENFERTLIATMKLSGLTTAPPGGTWRMSFTANAPGGVSDRGDQFYVQAAISPTPAFTFGTAVRNSDGSLTYTSQGTAASGTIDSTTSSVTVKVRLTQLAPFVTHGPAIATGSVLAGLRAAAFTTGANAVRDETRGGTVFVVPGCSPLGVTAATPRGPIAFFRGGPSPNPGLGASTARFAVGRAGFVELAVFDVTGARVRTLQAGNLVPGDYAKTWDGMNDHFSPVRSGMYFFVLNTADGVSSQRVTLVR